MDFKYFLAPEKSMLGLEVDDGDYNGKPPALKQCSFCGQLARCFLIPCDDYVPGRVPDNAGFFLAKEEVVENLVSTPGNPANRWEPDLFYRGCMDCLRQGRFTVWHFTEAGDIEAGVLVSNEDPRLTISEEAISELSRTPSFWTFQQAVWLCHCNDFMAYLGEWSRDDFNQNAPDGDGQSLYAQVERMEPGEEWSDLWDNGFYLFRCLHCGKMRSFSDQD